MSSLVVDSAVAIKWFVAEPHSAEARRVLESYRAGATVFLAPDLIHSEFGNIVWKKHLFQGLTAADARAILAEFRNVVFRITPASDLLEEAFRLAAQHRRTVYDMLYVALSLREGCPMVTADEKLYAALHPVLPNIVSLADWR
jgi:predicted nucleic acid-binding protein